MRKNLLAAVVLTLACASMAMAHGPPSISIIDSNIAASSSNSSPEVGGASASIAGTKNVNGHTSKMLVVTGITKMTTAGIMTSGHPNERMLN